MRNTFWIGRREFSSYFFQPFGWFLLAGFLAISGWYFSDLMAVEGNIYLMRSELVIIENLTVLIVPIIAMRAIAAERETGTLELLLTAPVRSHEIILGKFLGGAGYYMVLLIPTLFYAIILNHFGPVDFGSVLSGYLGTACSATLFLSLGLLISTLCPAQFMTAIVTFLLIFGLRSLPNLTHSLDPGFAKEILLHLNYRSHLVEFRKGVVDLGSIVYFGLSTLLFLYLSTLILESERWR